ncbi:MAG: alpha/beta hydrolase [Bacteroidota bacterium]
MIFNVPGLRNSGPNHWQSHWETSHPQLVQRIEQANWAAPECMAWTDRLQEVLAPLPTSAVVLTGHSVGCAAIANWYGRFGQSIRGALLVAPSDVEHPNYPSYIKGFAPLHLKKLPFRTIVVASDNDHVVSIDRARYFAECWGSEWVVLSNAGHIEDRSGYGHWEEGWALVQSLLG